jgi:methylmalonyl-CoA/ethylmalonyl-CoA epimerase
VSLTGGQAERVFEAVGLQFGQVGILVDDLDRALAAHRTLGPWMIYTYDRARVPGMHIGGEPADFAFRIALNRAKPQTEFIQPLDGDNPYAAWLAEHGPGLHHLGYYVTDVEATTAAMEQAGFAAIMGGHGFGADGTGAYCYYDTVAAVGYIVEAIEVPNRRRPPEATVRLA